jgi:hypothetical protein
MVITDIGIKKAQILQVVNPLPAGWLNLPIAPLNIPSWAYIYLLSPTNIRCLQAQIAYDFSAWNYAKIGSDNELGRYQFTGQTLENYGLLLKGSCAKFGKDAVNRVSSWQPATIRKNNNSYANYVYRVNSLYDFLNHPATQDHLAYQIILDLYTSLLQLNAITSLDSPDVVAGMVYVAWVLGAGSAPTIQYPNGTGAYAWRFSGAGDGARYFNAGRYAVTVLSQ